MATDPAPSELLIPPYTQIERAWNLLTVLVRLGRPYNLVELASRCEVTPDLLEILCQIPGSPIQIAGGRFVTLSSTGVVALKGLVSTSIADHVPRFRVLTSERRVCSDFSSIYVRKRKTRISEDDPVASRAKRRILLGFCTDVEETRDDDDLGKQISILSSNYTAPSLGHSSVADVFAALSNSNQESALLSSLLNSSAVLSNFGNIDHVGGMDETEKICDDMHSRIENEPLDLSSYTHGSIDIQVDASGSKAIIKAGSPQRTKPDRGPTVLIETEENPVLRNETWRGARKKEIDISVEVTNEVISTGKIFLEASGKSSLSGQMIPNLKFLDAPFDVESTSVQKMQKNYVEQEQLKVRKGFDSTVALQSLTGARQNRRDAGSPEYHQQAKSDEEYNVKQKVRRSDKHSMTKRGNQVDVFLKTHLEFKLLSDFKSFIIEEEEGSGGYGTVYRARRKEDGKVFAIKCPHANAHSHHINNELRMLQRFGGKNFVIKFEGSFKNGDSECFLLEHVEHDRPEALKKEIDICELQWYGYCMFRALASLHKQGIVHRDVKPGNFLFSRKLSKGYLIDFNLANDLHQKFCRISKSEAGSNVSSNHISLPRLDSAPYNKSSLLSKNMKRPNKYNKNASQTADVSGVTSAKDLPSTRTSSVDKLKQPLPCKGRKELLNFVHEVMQSPDQKTAKVQVFPRKRIDAPLRKADRGPFILTPMPLLSSGNAVAGAGLLKNRGNGKQKREGPCVGTKGFRAPEVLFRSYHQGCKVDVWSAGVTLLYLIIGKAPFGGDPELNLKEIAKLRGSEDLWEVAKLHNCESSFPPDLLDVQSLPSTDLRDWCVLNTKRPEFLELIPRSLFDLLNKCLEVNPRRRITAEEALMNGFFTQCHESLRNQRALRRAASTSEVGSLPL